MSKLCEDYRVAVRNIRRDANDMLKDLKKEGIASEDEIFKAQDSIQKFTDDHIKHIDDLFKAKEKEVLEV